MDYDLDYYDHTLRLNSGTAEQISKIRWDFIAPLSPFTVLDYGTGAGWFRAFRPKGIVVDSFDIQPVPQSGIHLQMYDVTCMWDVLEHIPDPRTLEPIFALSRNVALTVPVFPCDAEPPMFVHRTTASFWDWKHFKPHEHVIYYTRQMLKDLFAMFGLHLINEGTPECPPRSDVHSYIFGR